MSFGMSMYVPVFLMFYIFDLDPAPVCVTLSESIGRRWQLRSGHKAWTYFLFVTNTYRGKEGRRREVNKRLGEVGENGLKSLVVLMCMRCAK